MERKAPLEPAQATDGNFWLVTVVVQDEMAERRLDEWLRKLLAAAPVPYQWERVGLTFRVNGLAAMAMAKAAVQLGLSYEGTAVHLGGQPRADDWGLENPPKAGLTRPSPPPIMASPPVASADRAPAL